MFTPEQIRDLRLALGLTAAEFADKIGVSEDAVWRWERGNRHPSYQRMVELNKLMNATKKRGRKASAKRLSVPA